MPTESPTAERGAIASDFALPATDGKTYTLESLRGENGLVIVFMCNHCPYVKAVLPMLIRDAQALNEIGINVAGINSNDASVYTDDAFDRMIAVAQKWNFPFPYLHDETQEIARSYGAVCTPECFGFDRALRLKYRGRIDASRKEPIAGARRDLYEAMRKFDADEPAPVEQFPALGCSIKWRMA